MALHLVVEPWTPINKRREVKPELTQLGGWGIQLLRLPPGHGLAKAARNIFQIYLLLYF